jgi:hypothetical protein
MADRQVATGMEMGPIIELKEGVTILALVTGLRATTGEYKGWLIDMTSPAGDVFSVNGHKILVDKIKQYFLDDPMPFEITRSGMAGRAVNYEVARVATTWDQLMLDEDELKLLQDSTAFVHDQIKNLPPRD